MAMASPGKQQWSEDVVPTRKMVGRRGSRGFGKADAGQVGYAATPSTVLTESIENRASPTLA